MYKLFLIITLFKIILFCWHKVCFIEIDFIFLQHIKINNIMARREVTIIPIFGLYKSKTHLQWSEISNFLKTKGNKIVVLDTNGSLLPTKTNK